MPPAPEVEPSRTPVIESEVETLRNGRYQISGLLGCGAQGETLLAWDLAQGQEVAIKRFRVRAAGSWKDVELAEREAKVLATLDHPCLPRYVDHFEADGNLYLVMQRIQGESLAARCARGVSLSQEEAWRFLEEIARILDYLHGRSPPVIHRDIKPGNVIVRPDGGFALVDFGSVQHGLRPQGGSTVAGTFGFMAPEQLYGVAAPATDVYAVGATLLCVLTGVEPEQWIRRGLSPDVRAALGPEFNLRLVKLLDEMLEPDPSKRSSNLRGLIERWQVQRWQGRRPWTILAASGIALAVGVAAWVGVGATHAHRLRSRPSVDRAETARLHWQQAEFVAASAALRALDGTPSQVNSASALGAHLLAGNLELAANAARRLVSEVTSAQGRDLHCLANALDARRGDAEALRKLKASTNALSCGLLRADITEGRDRLDLLKAMTRGLNGWPAKMDTSAAMAASLLQFEFEPSSPPELDDYYPSGALIDPTELLWRYPIGLAFALPIPEPARQLERALFESYLGNHAASAQALRDALFLAGVGAAWTAAESPAPGDLFAYRPAGDRAARQYHRREFYLSAILATRAGETKNARTYLELAPDESHGRSLLLPYLDAHDHGRLEAMKETMKNDPWWPTQQIWAEVAKRNPTAMVNVLRAQSGNGISVLPFAPPDVVRNAVLQQWLERDVPPPCWGCVPSAAIRDLVSRRRIAQAVGAEALERELGKSVERIREALLRRDIAVPLYVLSQTFTKVD